MDGSLVRGKFELASLIVTVAAMFGSISAHSQRIDSLRILGQPFEIAVPYAWTASRVDTGLCKQDGFNIRLDMPISDYNCGGHITVKATAVTPELRKERENRVHEPIEDSLFAAYYRTDIGNYTLNCGFVEQKGGKDPRPVNKADKPAYQKRKRELYKDPSHLYTTWLFYSINDTIEFLILFQGRVPHSYEQFADHAVRHIAEHIFIEDSTSIKTLTDVTNPFRHEPEQLPMDSVTFLKTSFKFPLLPGWSYDTTRTESERKTVFLRVKSPNREGCDKGNIVLSYRVRTVDDNTSKKDELSKITLEGIYKQYKPLMPKMDSSEIRKIDSTFATYEQHFYFTQAGSSFPAPLCPEYEEVNEVLYIIIYTSPSERIRIEVSTTYTGYDYQSAREYSHQYYRFIYLMAEANDFEQFYLNNKKD